MFGLWLQVVALTVSPEFHHWLHSDSQSGSHECPVTLLSKGTLDLQSGTGITVSAPLDYVQAPVFGESFFLLPDKYRLRPSRGPPSC